MATTKLPLEPLDLNFSLRDKVYDALKQAIMDMNVYGSHEELRLDERQLSADLGVSRTPVREAISRLEQEGFVRIVQRKGVFVVRKTKREVVEMIQVWAALEGMAARLASAHATDGELAELRGMFAAFGPEGLRTRIDEYSEANIRFHERILQLSGNELLARLADNLFAHMRAIRQRTIAEGDRAERSIVDHCRIIEALQRRQTDRAERLTRQHTLGLAAHLERHADYLEREPAGHDALAAPRYA